MKLTLDPIFEYLETVRNMSISTANEYQDRLNSFRKFVDQEFNLSINQLIQKLDQKALDVYKVLSKYAKYLCSVDNGHDLSPTTIKLRISTVRGFLESQSDNLQSFL